MTKMNFESINKHLEMPNRTINTHTTFYALVECHIIVCLSVTTAARLNGLTQAIRIPSIQVRMQLICEWILVLDQFRPGEKKPLLNHSFFDTNEEKAIKRQSKKIENAE